MTEGEIRSSDVDDIAKDMAVDYLNGEVTDDLHRAVYESIYEKVKDAKMKTPLSKRMIKQKLPKLLRWKPQQALLRG